MIEANNHTPWDSTYPYYFQLADLIKAVAESHSGVRIDETTHTRWGELMGLMREVDTHADETNTSDRETLGELQVFTQFQSRYPHISPEALGEETHQALMLRTRRILKLGRYVATADTPQRYVHLRAAEGVQTANLFADSATEAVTSQSEFTESFMPVLRSMGIAACMLDSAHDLSDDYREGRSDVPPTLSLRTKLLGVSVKHTASFIRAGFHVPVAREVFRAANLQRKRKAST